MPVISATFGVELVPEDDGFLGDVRGRDMGDICCFLGDVLGRLTEGVCIFLGDLLGVFVFLRIADGSVVDIQ